MGFTASVNVLGWPNIGKYGMEFSRRCALMVDMCLENCGQFPLSELACLDDVPHETQCGSLG